jgi:hypothetical protein
MPLVIIRLVCPEARVKFKNIDFWTEADFACYYTVGYNETAETACAAGRLPLFLRPKMNQFALGARYGPMST